jgi:hypothetical protein
MLDSRVIEVDGIFLGAAVSLPAQEGWRFVAADTRMGEIDGCVTHSLDETQRLAKRALFAARAVHPVGSAGIV